ncbi:MAG: MBL fold metallo-hydrolase [Chloroflexota bacterium]
MFLHQFFVRGLGHASYLVGDADAGVAAVVDPRRDVDAYVDLARDEGLRITEILETHVHNDYVSGAEELRQRTGATVRAAANAALTRPHQAIADGDEFRLGSLRFRVVATPGHTPDHVSFAVADLSRSSDDWVLFAGGALLVGTAARPDLLGGPEEAARAAAVEFATLRDRIATLPDWVELYPTHGAGSLCGSGIGGKRWSTIGYERRHNPALLQSDADAFRRFILTDQPTIPAYWRRMRALNQAGVAPLASLLEPRPMTVAAVEHAVGHDAVVVDAREPEVFAAGHIPGSFGIGLGDTFGTWVGSVVPADRRLVLVLAHDDDLAAAVVQLRRAGYDRVEGYLMGGFDAWRASGKSIARLDARTADELEPEITGGGVHVLDVREASEWRSGHIAGAIHIPGGALPRRLDDVPADRPLVVVCGGGYRSTVAASVLERAGRTRLINLIGGVTAYAAEGRPLVVGETPTQPTEILA